MNSEFERSDVVNNSLITVVSDSNGRGLVDSEKWSGRVQKRRHFLWRITSGVRTDVVLIRGCRL